MDDPGGEKCFASTNAIVTFEGMYNFPFCL